MIQLQRKAFRLGKRAGVRFVPPAAAPAFDPLAFSPTVLITPGPSWCFSDGSGVVPCAIGDLIRVWRNRGSAGNLVQATAANRYTLQQDGAGHYYAQHNGTSSSMTVFGGYAAMSAGAGSVMLAVRTAINAGTGRAFYWADSEAVNSLGGAVSSNQMQSNRWGITFGTPAGVAVANDTPSVLGWYMTGQTFPGFADMTTSNGQSYDPTLLNNYGEINGAFELTPTSEDIDSPDGYKIYGAAVFDTKLADADRTAMVTYLGSLMGLAI